MRIWKCAFGLKPLKNDIDPVVTPEQAYIVSQILEAIYESARTGQSRLFETNILCVLNFFVVTGSLTLLFF